MKATALQAEDIAAKVTLPFTDPDGPSRFASIHSNPPGRPTEFAAVVSRSFGKGRVTWCAAPIESHRQSVHRSVFRAMISDLARGQFSFELAAPPAVQAVVYDQADKCRILVCLVNVQELLPAVPVHDMRVRLHAGPRKPVGVRILPQGPELPFKAEREWLDFDVPRLDLLAMIGVTYT